MRTTVTLDDDVAAAIDQLRRDRHVGVSAAVNELVRRGLVHRAGGERFVQRTSAGNPRLDPTDVTEVLDLLDGPARR